VNSAEFKGIVLPMSKKLYHFARLLLNDGNEAEDAVQEVCLKLWNMREKLEEFHNLEAFSMKVLKNWCLDRIKMKKPVYVDNLPTEGDRQTEYENPHVIMERHDLAGLLGSILEKLPEQQRMAFQLRDIEGYDYEEIAEIMETNKNTIRVALSRARKKMREELIKSRVYG